MEYDEGRFINDIAQVLTQSPAIRMIDFYIGQGDRLHVAGLRLRHIGELIRSGSIKIVIDDARLTKDHAGAEYVTALNTMFVPSKWKRTKNDWEQKKIEAQKSHETYMKYTTEPISGPDEPGVFRQDTWNRASLVHEATHALLDLRKFDVIRARNEAAAFLAMMVYLFHTKELEGVLGGTFQAPTDIERSADEVARKKGLYTTLGVRLRRDDLQPLLRSVIRKYGYASLDRTDADGID
jgi:hypothetical protein